MTTRILILPIVPLCTVLLAGSPPANERDAATAKPHSRSSAKAKITVESSEAQPYDQSAGPALLEMHLKETFRGDIDGESPVRALQVLRNDHSASLVSVQRFRGKLGGRQGSFVLQGQEVVENGKSRPHGLWCLDREPMNFPGSGAKAALRATLEKL